MIIFIHLTEINEMNKLVIPRSSIRDRAQGHLNEFLKFLLRRPLVSLEGNKLPNSYLDLDSPVNHGREADINTSRLEPDQNEEIFDFPPPPPLRINIKEA